ncbi:MAG: HAD family hydrolase [Pseudomonadota bacterium]|nr:HAD family hydrolase [Pseudomonadota bacterium]
MTFRAILWDCDGVLIDSEHIACGHAARVLTDAGYPITTEDFIRRFAGQSDKHTYETIQRAAGFDIHPRIDQGKKRAERDHLFRQHLKPIAGIHDLLDKIRLPMAIASGSAWDRLELTLKITNLFDRFMPHIYPASLVKNGKPAPDIFLHAAAQLGVEPQHCLVIEDSENGVRAGKAAGMTVYGFTGGSHIPDRTAHARTLTALGADWIFEDVAGLADTIA